MIKDLESKIIRLEDLLQKISGEILANVLYEKFSPGELLAKSEDDINAMRKLADEMKDYMLLLKPERASSIRRSYREFMQPINSFLEILKKQAEPHQNLSKQALDYLRRAVTVGQDFIELSRDIIRAPSKTILEILRLKEICEAKDYISRVSIPEAVYVRLEYFRKSMESLKTSLSRLDQSIQELRRQISRIEEEISKFQQQQ